MGYVSKRVRPEELGALLQAVEATVDAWPCNRHRRGRPTDSGTREPTKDSWTASERHESGYTRDSGSRLPAGRLALGLRLLKGPWEGRPG
jgi:hypothetical protein